MLLLCLLAGLMVLTGGTPAQAARPVQVYEVTVGNGESSAMLQEAMREALVRATGRRDAATDPVLAPLLQDPQRYVRSVRSLGDARTQVLFDGDAIEKQISALGRSVWDSERPFTIVVLSPALSGAAADAARGRIEQIAETRGLPVSYVPMPLTDATGHELANDMLLQNAQSLGADDVLIGRTEALTPGAAPDSAAWQWTLLTGFSHESWSGNFELGINSTADALARVQGSTGPLPEAEALVEVRGVNGLTDYATLERMFAELPGVRRSGLEEAEGSTVTFRVLIRGGADAVTRALAGSPHLTGNGTDSTRLRYQYRP
jgi:hypothetical protein